MVLVPRSRSFILAVLSVALLCFVLGACGGSGDGSGSTSGQTSAGGAGGDETSSSAGRPDSGAVAEVAWPFFGRIPERTHYLPSNNRILDPPLQEAWSINTHALIEFPPAVAEGKAFVINKYGNGKAVRLRDHEVLAEINLDPKDEGNPIDVTAPVYYDGKVYGAFIGGTVAAASTTTYKKLWEVHIAGPLESSPLPLDGALYLGTNANGVVSLDADSGKTLWKSVLPGEVKASPSYHDGRLFTADYSSSMYALEPKTGKLIWRSDTSKVAPFGSGGFFSSPAVGFGRVYAARDDGTVYAFDERTGKVLWAFPTGAAVYGSPAIAAVPGTKPTIYIGAENGTFYALDAATGKPRWTYDVGGAVPGTATVIGHTAYVSSFATKKTVGIDVLDHRKTFKLDQSGYTPVVSDGRRLYEVGYYDLVGLEPSKR